MIGMCRPKHDCVLTVADGFDKVIVRFKKSQKWEFHTGYNNKVALINKCTRVVITRTKFEENWEIKEN